ncbi:MAG: type VI secretion system contractile sheath domain-containing protein, partial [Rhodobacterales bacterium]
MSLATPHQFDFSDSHFLANLLGECPSESQLKACLGRLVLAIEERLSLQLSGIIEAPEFSALESYWRGVESLIWEIAG